MELNVKTFARRDSATAILKKLGVDRADYGKYIVTKSPKEHVLTLPVASTAEEEATVVAELSQAVGDQQANEALDTPPEQASEESPREPRERVLQASRATQPTPRDAQGRIMSKGRKEKPAKTTGKAAKRAPDGSKLVGKQTSKAKPKKAPAASQGPTIAGRIRELVAKGKSNAEIWAVIQPEFDIADDKRWYPSWYRGKFARDAKRKG